NGLARDIQRYLANEVVEARPPSAGYRLRKFARRNRGPVIASTLIVLALVLGLIGTLIGFVRAEQRRVEADNAWANEEKQRIQAEDEKRKDEKAEEETLASYRASTDDAIEQLIGSKAELGPKEKAYLETTLKRWQNYAARHGDDDRSRILRGEGHF